MFTWVRWFDLLALIVLTILCIIIGMFTTTFIGAICGFVVGFTYPMFRRG